MTTIRAEDIRAWLSEGRAFTFIDVREDGQYGEGHLLHAVSLPYSRLERDVWALAPSATVPVVLVDDGEGVAAKAARRLSAIGYADVRVLDGDLAACAAAGFTIFKGVNVPSKTLGELAEEIGHTPSIDAEDYKRMLDAGDDVILLDGRTPKEFEAMSIPGGRSCPNAELPFRLPLLVDNPKTTVVVNCAGRTRSLVGAQSLRNFGFENPIFALKNGTQGWRLAGFELDNGKKAAALPAVSGDAEVAARARAASFMQANAIPAVDAATVSAWAADTSRPIYLLDVRTAEEFAAGHIAGAVHAPGGQLVQATDKWVAMRGARIVLTDDSNVRAANSAYWLRAMGHDAHVLDDDASDPAIRIDLPAPAVAGIAETLPVIDAADLAASAGATVLDLRTSADFRAGHIKGAVWAIRPRLDALGLDAGADVVLVADDKATAEMAALDLRDAGVTAIRYLAGRPSDWRAAGLETEATPDRPSDAERLDYLFFVHDRHMGNAEASRAYLAWELGLIGQLKDWELALFPIHDGHG